MFTKKFLKYSTLFLASASLCLGACGDDPEAEPDATVVDGPDPTWKEGGMVIFEYIGFSTALQAAFPPKVVRNISHFTSAGGDDHVFLTPGTGNGTAGADECNHVSADDITWPANDVNVQTHVNMGDITISGGPQDLVVSPNLTGSDAEMTDMISRLHSGAWYQTIKAAEMPAPDNIAFDQFVVPDTVYSVSMEGSADYPATTYTDNLYMPAAMVMTNPTGDVTIDRPAGGFTEPYTVTWNSGDSSNMPEGTEILSLIMLVDGTGTNIIEFCVTIDDGEFVIPVEVLEEYYAEQPTGGAILIGNVSHQLGLFDNGQGVDDRRIDFMGMWCEAMAFGINQL